MNAKQFREWAKTITIIRHAESSWNAAPIRIQGQTRDPSIILSPAGRASVKTSLVDLKKPHVLISSPLIRCKQTAEAWFDTAFDQITIPTRIENNLAEINVGIYEGLALDELKNDPLWSHWMTNPDTFPGFPQGESLPELQQRVLPAMSDICIAQAHPQQRICVLTHGVVMRVIKCFLDNKSLSQLWTYKVENLEQIHLSPTQINQFKNFREMHNERDYPIHK